MSRLRSRKTLAHFAKLFLNITTIGAATAENFVEKIGVDFARAAVYNVGV